MYFGGQGDARHSLSELFFTLELNMARFLRPNIRTFVTSQLRMSSDQVNYAFQDTTLDQNTAWCNREDCFVWMFLNELILALQVWLRAFMTRRCHWLTVKPYSNSGAFVWMRSVLVWHYCTTTVSGQFHLSLANKPNVCLLWNELNLDLQVHFQMIQMTVREYTLYLI